MLYCRCDVHRAPRKQYQAYTTVDSAVSDASSRTMQVSATEAAAWVTGKPAYEHRWPECWGRCRMGLCALKWDHPACCYVRPSEGDRDDSGEGNASPSTVLNEGKKAETTSAGYWHSRNFFCWR